MQQGLNEALEVQSEPGLSAEERLRKLVKIRLDHLFGPAGHAHILTVSQRAHLSDMAREKIIRMQREVRASRSEEHTSELQSLMRKSYAGFCMKTKKTTTR